MQYVDDLDDITDADPKSPESRYMIMNSRLLFALFAQQTVSESAVVALISDHSKTCSERYGDISLPLGATPPGKRRAAAEIMRAAGVPGAWIIGILTFAEPLNRILMSLAEAVAR